MIRIKDKDYLIIDGDFYRQEPISGLPSEFKLIHLTLEQKVELIKLIESNQNETPR